MVNEYIRENLFNFQDKKYKGFQKNLMPTVEVKNVIGVRTPALRSFAKELAKREDIDEFLNALPHEYFDENQLHAFIISEEKDYEKCMEKVEKFLPFVDNWATCDQLLPKCFKKHKNELLTKIKKWLKSDETYTVRFGIGMLMRHYLDEDFKVAYPKMVAKIRSDEYYINMMIAWYFATALAKKYDEILPFIQEKKLDDWTHNKAIQKAIESYRVADEQKVYLRTLKVKK
ncbi:MAG: DNA alkylation repair protein [Lachnospiraceae bacterium]|nr:DNA alkylation repair protein [Lachnospiraceae bacterium]